jgi:hypothetical protein
MAGTPEIPKDPEIEANVQFGVDQFPIHYTVDEFIGLVRVRHLEQSPFKGISLMSESAHLILIPWTSVNQLFRLNRKFEDECIQHFDEHYAAEKWLSSV